MYNFSLMSLEVKAFNYWIRHKNALLAFFTTLCAMLISWLIVQPNFTETSDDAVMSAISYGYFGEYDEHLFFINILLGLVLKGLMHIAPTIPWYALFQVGLVFISCNIIIYIIFEEFGKTISIAILFLLYYSYEMFSSFQFTKTAGIAVISGSVLLLFSIRKHRKLLAFGSGVLIFIGSLYRFSVLPLVLVFIGGFFVAFLFDKSEGKYVILKCIMALLITVIVCFLGRYIHRFYYANDLEWADYAKRNVLRAELVDHGFPSYKENIDLYQSLNITENDLNMYENYGMYGDTELFTLDVVEKIYLAKKEFTQGIKWDGSIIILKKMINKYYYFWSVILVSTGAAFFNRRARTYFVILYEILAYLLVNFYFYNTNRYLQNRVDFVIVLAMLIVLLFCTWSEKIIHYSKMSCILVMLLLSSLSYYSDAHQRYVEMLELQDSTLLHDYMYTNADKTYFYFEAWNTLPDKMFNLFDLHDKGYWSNSLALGTWRIYTPVVKNMLYKRNTPNPYRALAEGKNTYFVCTKDSYLEMVKKHLIEHYDDVDAHLVDVIDDKFYVYRFY